MLVYEGQKGLETANLSVLHCNLGNGDIQTWLLSRTCLGLWFYHGWDLC